MTKGLVQLHEEIDFKYKLEFKIDGTFVIRIGQFNTQGALDGIGKKIIVKPAILPLIKNQNPETQMIELIQVEDGYFDDNLLNTGRICSSKDKNEQMICKLDDQT